MLDDEVTVDQDIFVLGTSSAELQIWDIYQNNFHKILGNKNTTKILLIETDLVQINNSKTLNLTEVRVLPKEYESPVGIEVYGSITCIILDNQIIRFDNGDFAKRMKIFFNNLWKVAKKV